MVPGSQECSSNHVFEQHISLQGSGIRVNVDLMPSALELCQMVKNVGVLQGSVLKDCPKMFSVLKISCSLKHGSECLPHIVGGGTSFSVDHEILGYVCGDKHLGVVVIVDPVPSAVGIVKWVWTYNLPVNDVLDLYSGKEIIH